MNKKLFVLSIVLAIGVLGLSGCGKSISDRMTESLIEKSTGGQADVNTNDGNIKVSVEGMNIETGDNVSLPKDFPTDVYLPENKLLSAMTSEKSYTVSLEVKETQAEIFETYKQKIADSGWKIVTSGDFGGMQTVNAEKDNRILSIIVSPGQQGRTAVVLSEYLKEQE